MCLANKITLVFITTLALEAAINRRTDAHTHAHSHTHSGTGTNGERSSPSISLMKWLPKMDDMTSPPPPITISPLKILPLKAPRAPLSCLTPTAYCIKWTMSIRGPIRPSHNTFIGLVIHLFNAIGWSGCLWMQRACKSQGAGAAL